MEPFPFTDAEWDRVKEVALSKLNATFAEDDVLSASLLLDLMDVLNGLCEQHGDHPVLLETKADYTEDEAERVALYRRATEIASSHSLPTLSIRLSLARVLLDAGRPTEARAELRACERELGASDDSERGSWAELDVEARPAAPSNAPSDWHQP